MRFAKDVGRNVLKIKAISGGVPPFLTGTASMRAASVRAKIIKAAEAAALMSGKKGHFLKCKYQSRGRHGGMSVLVDLEAGHLEIGDLIDESAILCA